MTPLILAALIIIAPIVLFLGWFRRKTARWMAIWLGLGGVVCAGLLALAARAPSMDWGYTYGLFWLWLAFFVLGGFVQAARVFPGKSTH